MPLRLATPDDQPELENLLRLMLAEIGLARVNEPKAREAISRTLRERTSACALAEWNGEIVGALGLVLTSWWYSSDNFMTDLFFFIHPEHRADKNVSGENAGHATKLIGWAKDAADRLNIPLVISVGTDIAPLPKVRFMSKHMRPFGGSFIHKPRAA